MKINKPTAMTASAHNNQSIKKQVTHSTTQNIAKLKIYLRKQC